MKVDKTKVEGDVDGFFQVLIFLEDWTT